MKFVRRRFLKWGLLSTVASGLPKAMGAPKLLAKEDEPLRTSRLSILQGATDESQTQFSILHSSMEELFFHVVSDEGVFEPDHIELISSEGHPQILSKVYFSQLPEKGLHRLVIMSSDQILRDEREFKMLSGDQSKVEFAVASCMDDHHHKSGIWKEMVDQKPEVLFFLGDSVYADKTRSGSERAAADPKQLWRRFCDGRNTLEIYHSKRLIPIFATWDDHDFGQNDTGKTFPWVKESQRNFLNFFAMEPSHCRMLMSGPGVSSALTIGKQLFLLMDNRSFRETGHSSKRYAHWGEEQEKWALEQIDQHKGFVWILNGSQIVPSMIFKESMSGDHPENFKAFMGELKIRKNKVAFISGDVHFSEISRIEKTMLGYKTYEFTSSSIHSKAFPGVPDIIPNKRRIEGTGKRNFLLLKTKLNDDIMEIQVTSHSKKGRTNFKNDYQV